MAQETQTMLQDGSGPYYKRLAGYLMDEIKEGRYAIGASLPTEKELCDSFGVSRHTTREALRQLENKGLITRRQGSGSTVVATSPPVRYEQNIQTIEDMLHHGKATRLHVLSSKEVEPDANQFASQVTHLGKTPCIWVRSIRYPRNDVRPLALVDVYVAVRTKMQARKLLDEETAAQEIVNTVDVRKIDRIEQAFNAVNVADAEAKLLHVKAGDAAFQIVRHYYDAAGRLLVVAHSLYHGSLFTYASTLRRS
ncbi:GntR family transcriptional regulator [Caenimonas soli]|uniref:GntR family transcriptional regulator n=1 Tax=Caenimonas soli TaxID=2735555 RepID=UPI001557A6EF|nr:GntR family transcriptional regulator [Caenimonas soli]NPC56954.1 GntR family transcriptional regulator [Caenimonas soli]